MFDPNFAPPGMKAVKVDYEHGITCRLCFYYQKKMCSTVNCCACERPDKTTSILVKKDIN